MSLLIKALKQAERVNHDLPAVDELDDDSLTLGEDESSLTEPDSHTDSDVSDALNEPVAHENLAQPHFDSGSDSEALASRDPSPMSLEALPTDIANDQQLPLPRHEPSVSPESSSVAEPSSEQSVRSVGESMHASDSDARPKPVRSAGILAPKARSKSLLWFALASAALAFGVWYFLSAKVGQLSTPVEPSVTPSFQPIQTPTIALTSSGSAASDPELLNPAPTQATKQATPASEPAEKASAIEATKSTTGPAAGPVSVQPNLATPDKPAATVSAKRNKPATAPALPAVRFNRTKTPGPSKHDLLRNAYAALVSGDNQSAAGMYQSVLKLDRNSSDAWIGLAAIAARRGDAVSAEQHYRAALRINPNDAVAQAGLTSLIGDTNLLAQESQLRNLAANKNSGAAVQFALGNTLSAQGRWNEAQRAYFDASSVDPAQPDYAFNLAVALEHIRQPVAAANHYKRAIEAAKTRPAQFSIALARERINSIERNAHAAPAQSPTAGPESQ